MVIEFIKENATIALFLGAGLFSAIGYYWRRRRERKENLRTALFFLAQIWHALSMTVTNFDRFAERYLERIQAVIPGVEVSPADAAVFRAYIGFNLKPLIAWQAANQIENLDGSYEEAVRLVAKTHPIMAYDLATASKTRESLALMDSYLANQRRLPEFQPAQSAESLARLQENMTRIISADMVEELEGHLARLALGASVWTWFRMKLRIWQRRSRMRNGPPNDEFDRFIREAIVPALLDL